MGCRIDLPSKAQSEFGYHVFCLMEFTPFPLDNAELFTIQHYLLTEPNDLTSQSFIVLPPLFIHRNFAQRRWQLTLLVKLLQYVHGGIRNRNISLQLRARVGKDRQQANRVPEKVISLTGQLFSEM